MFGAHHSRMETATVQNCSTRCKVSRWDSILFLLLVGSTFCSNWRFCSSSRNPVRLRFLSTSSRTDIATAARTVAIVNPWTAARTSGAPRPATINKENARSGIAAATSAKVVGLSNRTRKSSTRHPIRFQLEWLGKVATGFKHVATMSWQ